MLSQTEALSTARKLVRTFASAPDPRRQARLILATLIGAGAWTPPQSELLARFEAWLNSAPPTGELRMRCFDLVGRLPDVRS